MNDKLMSPDGFDIGGDSDADPGATRYRYICKDEVPYDDGTPTGTVFIYRQRFVGIDPLTGEEDWEDVAEDPYGPVTRAFGQRRVQLMNGEAP